MDGLLINPETISITPASQADLLPILKLFDEAIIWLNQRGITKQWGTEPLSASTRSREQFMGWIEQGYMFIARLDSRVVGSLALNPAAPSYIASRWEHFPASAFYLEAFVTARTLSGQGVGRIFLQWAEQHAQNGGKTAIWLDCWAENAALVHYYQQMGFVPRGEFGLKAWRGQLFEKELCKGAMEKHD